MTPDRGDRGHRGRRVGPLFQGKVATTDGPVGSIGPIKSMMSLYARSPKRTKSNTVSLSRLLGL
jgi:hypothetical protein